MTYQEAYDKIIEAYFNNEIEPLDARFCICGTLCNKTNKWYGKAMERHFDSHGYTGNDFVKMEFALLDSILSSPGDKGYERQLFAGVSAALDVLKEIHRERGEDVDNISKPFTKRQLVN